MLIKPFIPRSPQIVMIEHMTTHERCNVFASPGIGKTGATVASLDAIALAVDTWPALVVGPLRVANSVWDREVEKWAQFRGLRVVKILGTEVERIAALKRPGEIYTIHYGLLHWLHVTLDGKWPFKVVVPDESTRLKHQRCSFQMSKLGKKTLRIAGSKNASALMRYAPRTERWFNLTGTPAPNGLKDLWGQHWPIDFGLSLGRSYTAFTDRWFYQRRGTSAEAAVFEPHKHAHAEIMERIAPVTVSLNAYDYFDVEKPREVDLEVELSDKLMKDYRKLHAEAALKLSEETTITAVNAGAVTNKCLQFASGHVYDAQKNVHFIHNEKLDRLDSLRENLNGAPLLVAYAFLPDRDAILKRFPDAELLPSDARQKEVEDRWNAGKIPMLVVHPASAGHGLNLQWGGCDICFYSMTWDAELYEQVIERLGPIRQMQAGFHRVVSVYRILVKGTFDTVVAKRMSGKMAIGEAIKESLRA